MNTLLSWGLLILSLWIVSGLIWNTLTYRKHEKTRYRNFWIGHQLRLTVVRLWNAIWSIPIAILEVLGHFLTFLGFLFQSVFAIVFWPVVPYMVNKTAAQFQAKKKASEEAIERRFNKG